MTDLNQITLLSHLTYLTIFACKSLPKLPVVSQQCLYVDVVHAFSYKSSAAYYKHSHNYLLKHVVYVRVSGREMFKRCNIEYIVIESTLRF